MRALQVVFVTLVVGLAVTLTLLVQAEGHREIASSQASHDRGIMQQKLDRIIADIEAKR